MEIVTSSGELSADAVILARRGKLHGIILNQASAGCSVIIYDNATAASGTKLCSIQNAVNSTTQTLLFNNPITCLNGLYADVTGSGATYTVLYSPE